MLCGLQNQHEAEIAALSKCRQLIGRASFALEKKRRVSHLCLERNVGLEPHVSLTTTTSPFC